MVNYKRVVCEVAFLVSLAIVTSGAPAADCSERHYDQRQNGTENYRLNIDGVVIAVAPAESLLAAASDIDFSDLLDLDDLNEVSQKPKPPVKPQDEKPQDVNSLDSSPEPSPKPGDPAQDVAPKSDIKSDKKEYGKQKREKTQRLKQRLANILLPLLKRNRHH